MKKSLLLKAVALIVCAICIFSAAGCSADLPEPEIRNGEFDFCFTYTVGGEEKTLDGTYVCEFVKTEKVLDGISREWNGYIKGHEADNVYELAVLDDGTVFVDLDLDPKFFMSDPFYKSNANTDEPKPEPVMYLVYSDPALIAENGESTTDLSAYDIEFDSFVYDKPVENIFE